MNEPIINPDALADLDDIWFYIARDDDIAADRTIDEIYDGIAQMAEHPQMGHTREDLTGLPVRFWTVGMYLVVYHPTDPIEIVRVLHGYRDVPTVLS